MARIGNMETTDINIVKRNMSPELIHLCSKAYKESGTKFEPMTYSTVNDGSLETIRDIAGNVYGYDHGSCKSFGF